MNENYLQQLKKGTMDLLILSVLERHASYGYELVQLLNQYHAEEIGEFKEGTVYPVLYRLEQMQLIESEAELIGRRRRKVYQLTSAGIQALADMQSAWHRYMEYVERILKHDD
jgi:PadR family transcriptional regulator PadR